jgi:hypothetical protein
MLSLRGFQSSSLRLSLFRTETPVYPFTAWKHGFSIAMALGVALTPPGPIRSQELLFHEMDILNM